MPELPDPKLHPHPARRPGPAPGPRAARGPRYAELWARSNFSFLVGASHPEELVTRAAELGYAAIALTDQASFAGVVRGHLAAKEAALPLAIGAELNLVEGDRLVLLAPDRAAYGGLCRLITEGRRRAAKGECRLTRHDLAARAEGLVALLVPADAALLPRADAVDLALEADRLRPLARLFPGRAHLVAALREGPDDRARLDRLEHLEVELGLPLVAATGASAHAAERRRLRDVLAAIREGATVRELGDRVPAHGAEELRAPADLARLYRRRPELLERAADLASELHFSLDELRYEYPDEIRGRDLRELVMEGARRRWPDGTPERVLPMIEHELALIEELRYESYFLTVHDLVRFARERGILCQGRGSAANSTVCYCLGVTNVDPANFELLFERFISRDRNEPPDIDVDFEHERREEVLQYVYERYGRDRAGLAATVITYRGRSAVRDVGKALGLSLDQVERLSHCIRDRWGAGEVDAERLREAGLDPEAPELGLLMEIVAELRGFPRHLSQHVGGMVVTRGRLDEIVPIENAAMPDRTVIQWDKDDLDAVGLLKVDCLALGMLTAIRRSFDLIAGYRGRRFDLATVPREVPAVYAMAEKADTVGVFQIESRAQMAMLPRFRPRRFYDLVIEVAIVRPGPIQGGMVHPYLKRRAGEEPVTYPSEEVRSVLDRTLGVPIFQEQVMKLAVVAAGFTPGEADQLRRAMGAWRRNGMIERFREKLMNGMRARGYREEFADALYRQICGFGEYGFPESHAASFAHLTYVSLWLKRFEPAAFCCALLNSLPMGFYGPSQLIADARAHGVDVRPPDVTRSRVESTLETDGAPRHPAPDAPEAPREDYGRLGPALRLGLGTIKGLAPASLAALVAARETAPFRSPEDCRQRSGLGEREARILAEAGAFRGLSLHRRDAWWRVAAPEEEAPLYERGGLDEAAPELAPPTRAELVAADYRRTGYSLEAHPLALVREELERRRILSSRDLAAARHGWPVAVAGLCVCRQKPSTASGILFATLEDEHGFVNAVVREREQEAFRAALLGGSLLLVKGKLERVQGVAHVIAGYIEDLTPLLAGIDARSRDFH
ncbi:MAG: error-prone DNA polymerase [Planctomycetota bacterium]